VVNKFTGETLKMAKVYIASSLFNADRVKEFRTILASKGINVTYDWTIHGKVDDPELLETIAKDETQGVLNAGLLFAIHPMRTGSHIELGIALAKAELAPSHMAIVMLDDTNSVKEQKSFYYLKTVNKFDDAEKALQFIYNHFGIK
jgi:nucleoside 2-deoxyribosyltransferase